MSALVYYQLYPFQKLRFALITLEGRFFGVFAFVCVTMSVLLECFAAQIA
jgi:hypothetical protein